MACKFRDEIVGKRFLSVSGFTKLKLSKISEWGWRAGVIRAASHKDNTHKDLQVLVEYDDMEWHRREWISIFKENLFHVFMVESSLIWSERQDPFSPSHGNILWPALNFIPLVSSVDLSSQSLQPVEFLLDQELAFREPDTTQPFKEWDSKLRGVKDYPDVKEAARRWMEAQDGQRILLTTPSVLVGFRVEVYRSEGTTQWYTAVICGYNEATHELTVTDDTVLEGHNEDPCLVQMRLIGDRVVESIMRGEDVGITPRRSRSSTAPTLPLVPQIVARFQKQSLGVVNGSKQSEQTSAQVQSTRKYLRRPGAVQIIESSSPSPDTDKGDGGEARVRSLRRRREIFVSDKDTRNKGRTKRIKGNGADVPNNVTSKEDLENKGKKKQRTIGLRSAKKNVLEEANNSKLRRLVEVRVEDCLRRVKDNSVVGVSVSVDVPNVVDNSELSVEEDASKCDDDTGETPLPVTVIKEKETLDVTVEEKIEEQQEGEDRLHDHQIELKSEHQLEEGEGKSEQQQPVEGEEQREEKETDLPLTLPDDDDGPLSSSSPYNRMELAGDGSTTAALLRFPDDRSDSGVSSLRSGSCASGDERSGSRSSALSSSDEPTSQQTVGTNNNSNCSNKPADIEVIENTDNKASTLDLQDSEQQLQQQEQVRVWRDPSLLLVAEPHVRHVHSVQHQTLLMSHPPGSAPSAPPPPSAAPSPHYPPPPPLMSPHPLHLPPPASHHMYSQIPDMLWKQRYPPLPVGTHLHAAEELLERERAYAQDRDRHDRLLRDRREQEARELEKQKEREREREKVEREKQERERQERIEREKLEKQRAAEQAVHKHFEESLRLAHQKRMNTCWSILSSLPPPANRNSSGGTGEVDITPQNQQRLLTVDRERLRQDRDRAYFTQSQTQSRPQNVGSKVEYPPPPAHSRVVGVKPPQSASTPAGHTNLPKAEPNFNLFGYPAYQPPLGFLPHDPNKIKGDVKISQSAQPPTPGATSISSLIVAKNSGADREREMGLPIPNPPPLMSDLKNSVIVKNEGKTAVVENVKPTVLSHSQSPKLRVTEPHYLPPAPSNNNNSLKTSPFEYRSPSQSPHPLTHHHSPSPHPQYEAQNLASISKVHSVPPVHHRARQSPHPPHRQSPHPHRQSPHQPTLTQRQSPHHQHRQSPHAHVSSPDQRYAPSAASLVYSKPATVGSYPYPSPAPPPPPPLHYAPTVTTPPKPKVSSPAPPHIYGKPTSGITAGTPVCRAQELRVSPLPLTSKAPLTPSPYQQLPQHQPPPPPHQVATGVAPPPAHSSRSSVGIYDPRLYPPPGPGLAVSVKPPPSSPPSRSSPLHLNPGPNLAVTPAFQTQPLDLGVSSATKEEQDRPLSPKRKVDDMVCLEIKKRRIEEPVLSRVSEPSPLLASAATTITTVVNTAITEGLDRPKSASTPGTPAPPACPSPNTPAKPPSGIDSEKSNSPGPPPRPSYPVHKLKKAWLQRHSGEDGTDDKDVVGSGSCVTLPLTLPTNTVKKESESVSAVMSLHNIGSMAINSISKTKPKGNRKSNKDPPLLNGHTSVKLHDADDSSSSDPERKTSPPKRIPPKVKRKKGGRKIVTDENKRKKLSASSTDSDKESGSEKESDSSKKVSGGQNDKASKDNAKKRGRRPKTTQPALPKNEGGEEPRQKKPRDEPPTPPQRDPFAKPPVGQLKKSGESFLQDGPCFEVAPKLAKCRECRWTPNQRSRNMPNIFCRFYAFRRLRYTKNGQLAIAGFSDPHRDASQDDLKLWLPMPDNPPADLDLEMSRFLLTQVGDQFCDLLEQEKEAISVHMSDDKTIAWKRVVQGVREMCDVCETTLFNFHWACGKCGFVVCIDCYKGRKNGTIKMWGEPGRDRDDLSWLLCTNRQPHEQDRLMLTQIIAGDSLLTLGRRVHEARATWGIPMHCGCPLASQVKPTNGICKDLLKNLQCINEPTVNGQLKNDNDDKDCGTGEKKTDDNNSTLSWLADVALSNEDKKPEESGSSSDSDEDRDGNYSTLRELLIRPSHKSNGSRAPSPGNNSSGSSGGGGGGGVSTTAKATGNKKSHLDTLDEVISSVIEHSVQKECPEVPGKAPMQLKHFVRRYNWAQKGREPLPIRIMTLTESKMLYPDIPHAWLCDGKLLRLIDPNNSGNYRIFQDQWKRGQPVIVSDVTKHLNMGLWHPDSFATDFGDTKNDLVNCMTGNLVPNQPMRRFWEGFENFSKRLKDERGNHMLLKLKDWPPGEDFAEMLPSRFNDLMKVLPLGEYSQRSGRLNLASRLPDCFVRPDLGPKMYTAYGSALYATKGTTNLHLDISDAVNVMVYVGIPKDGDNEEHIKEAFRAIDEAGCDILTRRRVREKGELPGALWHIYTARDADKIRDLLNKVALERGARLEPHHDPIHDQSWYLDGPLRERLYKEYAVEGYAIVQCLGDAVFIPAGAPHQVRNLHNCIKVAEDFVSPENVSHCFHLTQEFRELSDTHSNHEDKLQIKNIIYHAVKDALSALGAAKENVTVTDIEQEMPIKQEDITDS